MRKKKRMIQFLSFAHIERTFHIFANDDLIRKSFKCPTNYTSYLSTHSFCCRCRRAARGCNESHYNVVSRSLNRYHSPFIIYFLSSIHIETSSRHIISFQFGCFIVWFSTTQTKETEARKCNGRQRFLVDVTSSLV